MKRMMNKLYGGLNMSWLTVLLMAVCSAVVTAIFLIVPVFEGTSFAQMGVKFEAWIFLAVIIMANCKKPLESAVKVFVFFLVSQPLIYLFQVPFAEMGWGLFRYYRYWFILTLLTFPVAYLGWYINRRDWISVLIFAPVLAFLAYTIHSAVTGSPRLVLAALFCLLQIVLYVIAFFPKPSQKLVGAAIPVLTLAALLVFARPAAADMTVTDTLPGEPSFSDAAIVTVEDASVADITFADPSAGRVRVEMHQTGVSGFTVQDGDTEAQYQLEIYDGEDGVFDFRMEAVNP